MSEKVDSATRIRQAAVEVLLEVGVRAATTRMVTDRAGVGRGLLNHYFRWSQLRAEAWGEIFEKLFDEQFEPSRGPADLMEEYFSSAFDERYRIYWFLWIDATDLAKTDAPMAMITARVHSKMLEQMAANLAQGTEQGLWPMADPHGTALRLSALYDGLANLLLADTTDLTSEQAEQHLRHLFLLETRPM